MRLSRFWLVWGMVLLLLIGCNRDTAKQDLPSGVLYQDDFETNSGNWILESDMDAEATITEGQLRLAINSPNLVAWAELSGHKFDDFVLEVDASQLAGPDDNSYGVIFRMKEQTEFYRFDVSGDGYYEFSRRNDDEANPWTSITEWLDSDAIHKGASTNQIKIEAEGDHFSFYVNGQLVVEADDNSYRSGGVGLDAGSFSEAGVQVAFDNLTVSEPQQGQ